MDLSFQPLLPEREIAVSPAELALLVAAATAVRATSATARAQAILDAPLPMPDRFAPAGGSFDAAVAAALERWRDGRKGGGPE